MRTSRGTSKVPELRPVVEEATGQPVRAAFFEGPPFGPELEAVLAACVRNGEPDAPIRVWVPACGRGEDVYALAILLAEQLEAAGSARKVRIFATARDATSLRDVRAGTYAEGTFAGVDPARLRRFFSRGPHGCTVVPSLRAMVVAAAHDLHTDLPFTRLDLVWCRNALPALKPADRERLLGWFHLALRPRGHLVLVDGGGVRPSDHLFEEAARPQGLFVRLGSTSRGHPPRTNGDRAGRPWPALFDALKADRDLLHHFGPSAAAVRGDGQIVRFYGDVNRYLRLPGGTIAGDLLVLSQPGLRPALRAAWNAATADPTGPMHRVEIARRGEPRLRVTIRRVAEATDAGGLWLVVFEEQSMAPARPASAGRPAAATKRLEAELRAATCERHRLAGELEGSHQALQAMDEEARSMNEELQSTTAQLVTVTDDLLLANERLSVLNVRLEDKVRQLTRVNDDIATVLASIDVAMVFLDADCRVTRFTSAAAQVFHLLPSDAGRPIDRFAAPFAGVDLAAETRAVLARSAAIERAVDGDGGRRYYLRILPYQTGRPHVRGAVLTAVDITALEETERELRRAQAQLSHLNDTLERRVEERTAWLTLLRDVASAISDAPTSTDALHRVLRQLCVSQGWQVGFVYRPEPISDVLVPAVSHVDDGERGLRAFHDLAWRQRYARGDTLPGRVYADGAPVFIDDADVLRRSLPVRGRALRTTRLRAAALVPIVIGREVVAVLELLSTSAHAPEDEQAMLLADVSSQIAKVVERDRAAEEVSEFVWREQQELLHTLHDSLGQTLTGLGMLSAGLSRRLASTDPPAVETAQQIVQQARLALEDVRKVSKGLFPVDVDAAGLAVALRLLAETTTALHGIPVEVAGDLATPIRDGRVATQLYRIAQEAVTNAVKHARASRIRIRCAASLGRVALTIGDDGVGMPRQPSGHEGLGLRIMQQRAGSIGATLKVAAGPAGGTEVTCTTREPHPASGDASRVS